MIALTQVETVGLWVSLVVGVASVVLAIVAIYFSIEVDRRSTATASETLRALERIEAGVHTQSQDTRDLIKVGWERMLGGSTPIGSGAGVVSASDSDLRRVAEGLVAEIRSELGVTSQDEDETSNGGDEEPEDSPPTAEGAVRAFESAMNTFEQVIETQLRQSREGPGEEAEFWLRRLSELPDEVRAVARLVSWRHVTRDQLNQLLREAPRTGRALRELRRSGLLVPLEGYDTDGRKTTVYYFPPASARVIRAALQLAADPPPALLTRVRQDLEKVGYTDFPPYATSREESEGEPD